MINLNIMAIYPTGVTTRTVSGPCPACGGLTTRVTAKEVREVTGDICEPCTRGDIRQLLVARVVPAADLEWLVASCPDARAAESYRPPVYPPDIAAQIAGAVGSARHGGVESEVTSDSDIYPTVWRVAAEAGR